MAPRRRKPENADLPKNLYAVTQDGITYYVFEHPVTHKRASLGSDRSDAIDKATLMNAALIQAGITKQAPKIKRGTVRDALKKWTSIALDGLKDGTQKNTTNFIEVIEREIGDRTPNSITTADLYSFTSELAPSSQKRLKSLLVRLFDYMLSTGVRSGDNPANALHVAKQRDVKRQRLTLEQFQAIYDRAPGWMQSAMMLMLQTTLRPGDVLALKFEQLDGTRLKAGIGKVDKNLAIKLNHLALEAINRQRQSGLVCPYIIHRKPERIRHRKGCDHPFQVVVDYISDEFSAIRDDLGICADLDARQRPSLYEIRALAAHLYAQQGADRRQVQALMAHTSEKMTMRYQSRHETEWVEVVSGLIL